jgi:hypothetical protein
MTLVTTPLHQLEELTSPGPDVWLLANDPDTGKDYKVKKSNVLAGTSNSFTWQPSPTVYDLGNIVEWNGKLWKSLENDNEGNLPSENAHWTEVDPADESAIKLFQADKVYKSDLVVILYNNTLRKLKDAITRPYTAPAFVENDWEYLYSAPGVVRLMGNWDASGNAFPDAPLGSGPAGQIYKGNEWDITVPGTPAGSDLLTIGATIRAKVDNPGQNPANWRIYY